jgi:hypothetical protein
MNTIRAYPLGGVCGGTYTENLSWAKSTAWGRSSALTRAISASASGLKVRRAISTLPDNGEYAEKVTFCCSPATKWDDSCALANIGIIKIVSTGSEVLVTKSASGQGAFDFNYTDGDHSRFAPDQSMLVLAPILLIAGTQSLQFRPTKNSIWQI